MPACGGCQRALKGMGVSAANPNEIKPSLMQVRQPVRQPVIQPVRQPVRQLVRRPIRQPVRRPVMKRHSFGPYNKIPSSVVGRTFKRMF